MRWPAPSKYVSRAFRNAISQVSDACMPVTGGPKSRRSSRTRSIFSCSLRPIPTETHECGVIKRRAFNGVPARSLGDIGEPSPARGGPPATPTPTGAPRWGCRRNCHSRAVRSSSAAGNSSGLCLNLSANPKSMSTTMPVTIPWWMECGIKVMAKKLGKPTRKLSQAMLRLGSIMNAPIKMRGAAAAKSGIEDSSGVMKAEHANNIATTTADKPVRAPSKMPALLSLAMTNGPEPNKEPRMEARAVLATMLELRGTTPCRRRPAMLNKPYCTPTMSEIATKSITAVPMANLPILGEPGNQPEKSMVKAMSKRGRAKGKSGGLKYPVAQLAMATKVMLTRSAPLTRATTNKPEMRQKQQTTKINNSSPLCKFANVT
mmetsp:Transcript_4523/g.13096  ORF Transcript_4523/g.13096 Transcript_4523/m.13096 type:complete len:375 (+) Transcript_4523:99-1223(+)